MSSNFIAPSGEGQTSEQTTVFVDLDGTLVRTNTLLECILGSIGQPRRLVSALLSVRKGKAALKAEIAAISDVQPALFPFNQEFLALLRKEFAAGRPLVLATGADRKIALAVADHLGLFDDVIASDGIINLTGAAKLSAIRRMIGDAPFCYAGNGRSDLHVWQSATSAILVNTPPSVARAASEATTVETTFPSSNSWPKALLRATRPYQ
jgi:haloacid dehalogenase-like hydrolase